MNGEQTTGNGLILPADLAWAWATELSNDEMLIVFNLAMRTWYLGLTDSPDILPLPEQRMGKGRARRVIRHLIMMQAIRRIEPEDHDGTVPVYRLNPDWADLVPPEFSL